LEITARGVWTLIHGVGFGGLYILACSGALIELYRHTTPTPAAELTLGNQRFVRGYLIAMVLLAWMAVLTGTFVVYPWYRAPVPPGVADLSGYPQRFLLSEPSTTGWHSVGMEWKEHVGWFTPIAITMVAFVFVKYGRDLKNHRYLRRAVLGFTAVSFLAAAVAGIFGAMLNKYAPVQGGRTIVLSNGASK
jgi:hypothetical protein